MKTKKVEVDGKEIKVSEFTVGAIEGFFAEEGAIDALASAVTGGVPGTKKLLTLCTPLTEEELSGLGINAYARLAEAMKELNADFFAQYRRDLAELGKLMTEAAVIATALPKGKEGKKDPGSSAIPEQ